MNEDIVVSDDKNKILPTKKWLEEQVKLFQVAIERNVGAINLCHVMLKNSIYCEDDEVTHG